MCVKSQRFCICCFWINVNWSSKTLEENAWKFEEEKKACLVASTILQNFVTWPCLCQKEGHWCFCIVASVQICKVACRRLICEWSLGWYNMGHLGAVPLVQAGSPFGHLEPVISHHGNGSCHVRDIIKFSSDATGRDHRSEPSPCQILWCLCWPAVVT